MNLMNVTLLLAMLAAAPAFANEAPAPSADDVKKAEMMKKWQEASTPNDNHKILAPMAGNWTYTSKWWETADGKAQESKGTSKMKLIMGGRFLQHDVKGKAMGMPFEGMGITGYDNVKKQYNTLWLDNMSTGMMTGNGNFDAATNTLSDKGEFSCPLSESKTRAYRSEWKISDKNTMVYSMYGAGPEGGAEFKQMEMTFKRSK